MNKVETEQTVLMGSNGTSLGRRLRNAVLTPLVCSLVAAIGIFGGIASLIAGLLCVVIHSLLPGDTAFNNVGTALLILAIPMLLAGSVFLDEIGPKK